MGKRLTPEEREARIRAYEEAKAARQAIRAEKRKARLEAYEKAKAKREREKRGAKPKDIPESSKVGFVKSLPPFRGTLEVNDEVGFRFLGMAMSGKITKHINEIHYRDQVEGEEASPQARRIDVYVIKDSEGTFYPVNKKDIFCKKINNEWKEKA